jgi:hypothetical protein
MALQTLQLRPPSKSRTTLNLQRQKRFPRKYGWALASELPLQGLIAQTEAGIPAFTR